MKSIFSLSMPQLKMLFGFLLLICITLLAMLIAIGKVQQESSYGLPEILGGLLALAGGFANWAFGESRASQGTHQTDVTEGTPSDVAEPPASA